MDLKENTQYNVTVYAINGAGNGKPASILTPPIPIYAIGTATPQGEQRPNYNQYERSQSVAIIIGCGLASLCIALCITYMMWYRRCIKTQQQRQLQRNRDGLLNHNNTLNGSYAQPVPSPLLSATQPRIRIRDDNTPIGETYEMEYLVGNTGTGVECEITEIPNLRPIALDTKGPNGHVINGSKLMNGNVVRVIENPNRQVRE